jgi:ketosteroid isomerase-like protein
MSQNVEILRSIYEAVTRDDWDAAFRDQHPNVELALPGVNAPRLRGRKECQRYLEDLLGPFEDWTVQPERFVECGDRVAAVIRTQARPQGSSAQIELRNGHLWSFRDGKAQSMRIFPAPEEALEAIGLEE